MGILFTFKYIIKIFFNKLHTIFFCMLFGIKWNWLPHVLCAWEFKCLWKNTNIDVFCSSSLAKDKIDLFHNIFLHKCKKLSQEEDWIETNNFFLTTLNSYITCLFDPLLFFLFFFQIDGAIWKWCKCLCWII